MVPYNFDDENLNPKPSAKDFTKGNLPTDKIALPEGPLMEATLSLLTFVDRISGAPVISARAAFKVFITGHFASGGRDELDVSSLVYISRAIPRAAHTEPGTTKNWTINPLLPLAALGIVNYVNLHEIDTTEPDRFCFNALGDIPLASSGLDGLKPRILEGLYSHMPAETDPVRRIYALDTITDRAINDYVLSGDPGEAEEREELGINLMCRSVDRILDETAEPEIPDELKLDTLVRAAYRVSEASPELEEKISERISSLGAVLETALPKKPQKPGAVAPFSASLFSLNLK